MRHLEDAKMAANVNHADPDLNANPKSPHGEIFLGQDEKTFGVEGTGWVDYDPDFECGGPQGTPGRQCPHKLREEDAMGLHVGGGEGRLLHIAIASYRDPLCPVTLFNLFTKAAKPDGIRVRVLQQNDPELDPDCLEGYCKLIRTQDKDNKGPVKSDPTHCPHADQVFIHKIHAKDAAGPTYARGLLSADIATAHSKGEVKTQDHCLSIDSHMDFEPDWDIKMIDMWDLAGNEYAVLSTYVASTDQLGVNLNGAHEVPHLCMVAFTSNVRTHATKCARNLSKPKLTNAIWGAGVSFSKCHAELKVPVDPHTPHIFDGEEFNRAARFFTYGYDIYTPHRVYILHDYERSQHNPVTASWHKNAGDRATVAASHARLKTMIGVPGGETDKAKAMQMRKSKYGLGDRRSLEELVEFSGIDLFNGKFPLNGINRCGNIQWVPFKEHPKGVNYLPRFDEKTEDPLDPLDKTSVWYDTGVDVHGTVADIDSRPKSDEEKADRDSGHGDSPIGIDAEAHGVHEDLNDLHARLEEEISAVNDREGEDSEEDIEPKGRDEIAHDAHVNLHKHHAELRQALEKAEEEEAMARKSALSNAKAHASGLETDKETNLAGSDPGRMEDPITSDHAGAIDREGNADTSETRNSRRLIPMEHKPPMRGVRPGGLLKDPVHPATAEAGLPRLPLLVQITAMLLVLGVLVSVLVAKGTGDRKRRLARSKRIV